MLLTKYKITASTCTGYIMVVYQDGRFKSVLNEFNPPLTEKQLNGILNYIPGVPENIEAMFMAKYGDKVRVEPVKSIGAEPELDATPDYPVNEKIALFCRHYAEHHKDAEGYDVKYKASAADAGKLKALPVNREELDLLLGIYMVSNEWYLKPKSIANFIKKYNEIRAIAYVQPNYPIPYSEAFYTELGLNEKRAYHEFLKKNGYEWKHNPVRGGVWVLKETL
jgi:hypothetical protein